MRSSGWFRKRLVRIWAATLSIFCLRAEDETALLLEDGCGILTEEVA